MVLGAKTTPKMRQTNVTITPEERERMTYSSDDGAELGQAIAKWFDGRSSTRVHNIEIEPAGDDALYFAVDHEYRQHYMLVPVDAGWERESAQNAIAQRIANRVAVAIGGGK